MAALDRRISDLEAQAASTDYCVRVYFCDEGEDEAQARLKAGIPLDYAGKVICVQFIEPRHLSEELHQGKG
jgi:hypothetical protein